MSEQPCLHKVANHQHGTRNCYVLDRCRCEPCRIANRAYENDRMRQHLYGRWNGYVDAEPARQHVRSLMAQGMGLKRIVAVSDVSQGGLWKLVYGKKRPDGTRTPSRRIKPETERRILSIKPDLADGAVIDSTGATRRIQALVAIGWSQSKIAARLGLLPANFTPLVHGTRGVTVATARAVAKLYDELWDVLPPNEEWRDKISYTRAVRHAAAHGWAPPLAWDDELIDDPQATPALVAEATTVLDEVAIDRAMTGAVVDLSRDESDEALRRLAAAGLSDAAIAERLHITDRTVLRWRQRLNIESRWAA
jgi:transcriptional regulator with XRE-family HTH domain